MAGAAGAGGHADGPIGRRHVRSRQPKHFAAQQVPIHPTGGRSGPGIPRRAGSGAAWGADRPGAGATSTVAVYPASERQRAAASVHGVDTTGAVSGCVATAGDSSTAACSRGPITRGPPPGPAPAPPPPPAPAELPPAAVNPPQASGAAYGTTTRTPVCSSTRQAVQGCTRPVPLICGQQENWVDLMLYPRQT